LAKKAEIIKAQQIKESTKIQGSGASEEVVTETKMV